MNLELEFESLQQHEQSDVIRLWHDYHDKLQEVIPQVQSFLQENEGVRDHLYNQVENLFDFLSDEKEILERTMSEYSIDTPQRDSSFQHSHGVAPSVEDLSKQMIELNQCLSTPVACSKHEQAVYERYHSTFRYVEY